MNPLDGIEAAVTRLDPNGLTDVPLGVDEEISLAEAIENYTTNSAYVNFLEDKVGSIKVGKKADLVILDKFVCYTGAGNQFNEGGRNVVCRLLGLSIKP